MTEVYAPTPTFFERLRSTLRFTKAESLPRDETLPHILRLAETSPHLLADLGYARDPLAPGSEVWRDGHRKIIVDTRHAPQTLIGR